MAKKVVIGLSGGVDSAVSAYLLKEQGYDVHGLFMINWKDSSVTLSGDCTWEEDQVVAKLVARQLEIPLHIVDSSQHYKAAVVDYMFSEYEKGRTPNPDVLCNREIKFNEFYAYAKEIGADYVATGHYAKKSKFVNKGNTYYRLLAGDDPNKDQSYFLCQMSQEQLKATLFPIGDIIKPEVRRIAKENNLACAERKDSQGICFVGKVDLPVFLQQKLKANNGFIYEIPADSPIYDRDIPDDDYIRLEKPYTYKREDGKKIGIHEGAQFFTIGQRKGLNVGGHEKPLYVIKTDIQDNVIYVGMGDDHPGLYRKALYIGKDEIHWVRPDLAIEPGQTLRVRCRIRYRQPLQDATLIMTNNGLFINFDVPQKSITAGQFAAWYILDKKGDNELIGSGVIYR